MNQNQFVSFARQLCKMQHVCQQHHIDARPLDTMLGQAFRQTIWVNPTYQKVSDDLSVMLDAPSKAFTGEEYGDLSYQEREYMNARPQQKIEAIKLLRERTGLGLKEAKDACELWFSRHGDI